VTSAGDALTVDLIDQVFGIAPGQAVVVYDGSRVVGSATISATRRASLTSVGS
jgi:tRNA-specific 2-thiouridylase